MPTSGSHSSRSSTTSSLAKQALRERMRGTVAALAPQTRARADRAVCTALTALPEWQAARSVLLYHALPDEVDTALALEAALDAGKALYLPRAGAGALSFHRVPDAPALDRLARHRWGMLEPEAIAEAWRPAAGSPLRPDTPGAQTDAMRPHTLIVCPGRAFDRRGVRLGRGGGFYDRFLTALERGGGPASLASRGVVVAGIGYSVQLVDEVPSEPSDQRVGILLTEELTLRF